jgi:hypothetical protein
VTVTQNVQAMLMILVLPTSIATRVVANIAVVVVVFHDPGGWLTITRRKIGRKSVRMFSHFKFKQRLRRSVYVKNCQLDR